MRQLDLRTGQPVWLHYPTPATRCATLHTDISVDVLVVGMGISGAMTADLVSEAGLSVAMIDRRGPAIGSTPASTALIQFEIDQPLTTLRRMIGADKADRAWRRARLAVTNLRDRIEELAIPCHLASRPTLYLAGNVLTGSALREEAEARASIGLSARYLTASALMDQFGIARRGAILSRGNLAFDPVRLTRGLLAASRRRGTQLFAPEEAVELEIHRDRVTVHTRSGHVISAAHVVLATGYELLPRIPQDRHAIISTWAIATHPQKRGALWPGQALIWEASDPYLYLRTTHDGRIVCGGEDADIADEAERDALMAQKTGRLVEKLSRLLPAIDPTPAFAWAGSFGNTPTGLPLIGPLPGQPRITALMAYGGNGITFSRIAAEMIVTRLRGGADSDEDLFAL